MIDTHAHLHFPDFDSDRESVIDECNRKLEAVITVGCDLDDSVKAINLALANKKIFSSVGIHPHEAGRYSKGDLDKLIQLARKPKVVALGEMGLDFYRNLSPRNKQYEIFEMQVEAARKLKLPIIVHTRNADSEMSDFIKTKGKGVRGIIHCFSGDKELLRTALNAGFFISFSGNVTYPKNGFLREDLRYIPSSRLLVETDSPYLAPQPKRGHRNKPTYVGYTVKAIADYLNVKFSDIDRITSLNAKRIYNLPFSDKPSIVYNLGDKLYINLTTECPCNCKFCFRGKEDYVYGYNLHLKRKHIADEYIYRIKNPRLYKEIVFCGYGEPFERFDALLKISKWLKKMGVQKVRIDTCGLGYLITKDYDILNKLSGLVDSINVSLNACKPEVYYATVRPKYGKGSWESALKFIGDAKQKGFKVTVSAVKHSSLNVDAFIKFAKKLGVEYKLRELKTF